MLFYVYIYVITEKKKKKSKCAALEISDTIQMLCLGFLESSQR